MSPVVGAAFAPHPPIIIPEVGRGKEQEASKTIEGMKQLARKTAQMAPDTLVILTPHSHSRGVLTVASNHHWNGNLSQFGCADVQLTIQSNTSLVNKISEEIGLSRKNLEMDHGTLVPLYYIQKEHEVFSIVLIGVGPSQSDALLSVSQSLGDLFRKQDEKILILASGDLSHRLKQDGPYGLHPSGPLFDQLVVKAFREKDLDQLKSIEPQIRENAAECGLNPFLAANEMVKGLDREIDLLSYEGPFGVGYLTAFIHCNQVEHHPYVQVAREAIRQYVTAGKKIDPERDLVEIMEKTWLKENLRKQAGTFVSLHVHGKLRGCIGTMMPAYQNLIDEIIQNAIAAAVQDPRFPSLEPEELSSLSVKVDILGEMEVVESTSDLDPRNYGVMVEADYKRGVLLPDLDGVDTVAQQLEIAKQKAGIGQNEDMTVYRFQVKRFV